jgi:ABC-type oligopeptide transport system ATPase subunit
MEWFIKEGKEFWLEEHYRLTDLLNLDEDVSRFYDKINNLNQSSVVWLIGKLGSGKTTFINQLIKKLKEEWIPTFEFEAWKYPERKNLRENLILEIATQISPETSKKYLDIIKGDKNNDVKKLVKVVADLTTLSVLEHINYFLDEAPATRTFQLQEIFKKLMESMEGEKIYIFVEDADRAGKEGLFFLETLNYYIKKTEIDKEIIVVTLIGEENYYNDEFNLAFKKCLDLEEHFPSIKFSPKFWYLVAELFTDDLRWDKENHIASFLEGIFKQHSEIATMREIKSILRSANLKYKNLKKSAQYYFDPRLVIMFETAKRVKLSGSPHTSISKFRSIAPQIDRNWDIFEAMLSCVIEEWDRHESIYDNKGKLVRYLNKYPIKITEDERLFVNTGKSFAQFHHQIDSERNYLWISIEYLK